MTHKQLHFEAILSVSGRFWRFTTNAPAYLELLSSRKSLTTKPPGQALKTNPKALPSHTLLPPGTSSGSRATLRLQTGSSFKGLSVHKRGHLGPVQGDGRSAYWGFRRLLTGNVCAK